MVIDREVWMADLSRQFKRHRQGRPGWFLRVKTDRLRLLSDDPNDFGRAPAELLTA